MAKALTNDRALTQNIALQASRTDARRALKKWNTGGELNRILQAVGYDPVGRSMYKFHKLIEGYVSKSYATIDIYPLICGGSEHVEVYAADRDGNALSAIEEVSA